MAKTLAEIEAQLEEPFALEDIDFLPKGEIERDGKTFCMGMPFADPRVYQDRLNKLVPGEWSTPPPIAIVAGNKLITYVTVVICGVAHTDTGEAFLVNPKSNKPEENTATESWSQAFKRACSHFGLGRYLYSLDKAYLPYNKQYKRIDLDANGLRNEVRKLYVKAGIIATPTPRTEAKPASGNTTESAQAPNHRAQANNGVNVPSASASNVAESKTTPAPTSSISAPVPSKLRKRCAEVFGTGRWEALMQRVLNEVVPDDNLTPEDCSKLNRAIEIGAQRRQPPQQQAS